MSNQYDIINGDTRRNLCVMALPMFAAMLLNIAYNYVDSLWIGNLLGETAYAALTNATPIILVLTSIAMGATNGVSILLSQAIGSKDQERVDGLITTSLVNAILFSLLVTVVLECFLPHLLIVLGSPAETYKMACAYLRIYLIGYLFDFLFLYFSAVLRSFGNAVFQMLAMLISTILNAFLDPFFIRQFGFNGAAIATLLAQGLCMVFMIFYLLLKRPFTVRCRAYRFPLLTEIFDKAFPSIIQQCIPAISTAFLTALISRYGVSAIAAYGISSKLETILFYPAMALNMVLTTIVGQCIGSKRLDRANDYLRCALKGGCMVLLLLTILMVTYAKNLSWLFVQSTSVMDIVGLYFAIVGIGYILNTITNSFLGMLNGLGRPSSSMLLMIFYYIMIRMPLAAWLSSNSFGLYGIWFAILLSHICAAAAAWLVTRLQIKHNGHLLLK